MKRISLILKFCLFFWGVKGSSLAAVTYKFGGLSGVMQQPSSNYFHYIYGVYGEINNKNNGLSLRVGYLERPLFEAVGFVDQEFFRFVEIGSNLNVAKGHDIYVHMGGGEVNGFIKVDKHNSYQLIRGEDRYFSLKGLALAMEYVFSFSMFEMALSQLSFVGYGNDAQFKAYVAWPYHFTFLRIGMVL